MSSHPPKMSPQELLLSALVQRNWTQADLARELNFSTGAISRWCNGDRRPSLISAVKLSQLLGVPTEMWLQKKKKLRGDK